MTTASKIETRRAGPAKVEGRTLHGLVAPYGTPSHPIGGAGGFVESIAPGAFDRSIAGRTVALWWQHGAGRDVLASQRTGTLRLVSKPDGLHYEATLGNTATDDLYLDRVGRGLVPEMSFGFTVPDGGDEWSEDGASRTLKDVDLWEISPVEAGAYPDTKAARRGKDGRFMRENTAATELRYEFEAAPALLEGIGTLGLRDAMQRAHEIRAALEGSGDAEQRGALTIALEEVRERIAKVSNQPKAASNPAQFAAQTRQLAGREMVTRWLAGGGRSELELDLRNGMRGAEQRATMGVAVSGGVNFGAAAVQPTLERDFIKSLLGPTAVMRVARIQPCMGPYNKPLIGSRDDYTSGSVKAEGGTGTARDFNATSLAFAPVAHSEMYETSTELLEDASYDVAAEIADEIGIAQGIWWDKYFVTGSGSGQPQGITIATWSNTYTTAANDTLTVDDCLAAKFKINPGYWANAVWIMHPTTWGALRREKVTGTNAYVVDGQRDNTVLDGIQVPALDGHPVLFSSNMPLVADGAYPVVFGDFRRGYEIALRRQLTIKRAAEDATALQSGLANFVGNVRMDGRARDLGACIKVLVA
jgi:HK97 family phage major capsid protein/HK97 family phage prohead protease